MPFRDLLWWMWYSLKRRMRGERVPEEVRQVTRAWQLEDEACEGKRTPFEVRVWKDTDAHAVSQLPPGPTNAPFGPHDFWNYFSQRGVVGLVAEQAGKVVGVLVMWEMTVVRFGIAKQQPNENDKEPDQEEVAIGTRLAEFLRTLVSPLPQVPITVEIEEGNDIAMRAFKKAQFVATTIHRNQPEPGRSLYILECPPHIGWKRGTIRIVDGDRVMKLVAPQMQRQ